jgi:ATP-dependent Zn protease
MNDCGTASFAPTPDRCAAIHEAGHAVIARILGLACGEVTIRTDGDDELGYTVVRNPLKTWQRGDGQRRPLAEAHCMSLYAGAEAERVILGTSDVGDSADRSKAASCLSEIGVPGARYVSDDIWQRYEARLRRKARDLVSRHRREIERVARELQKHKTLSAERVDALLQLPIPA